MRKELTYEELKHRINLLEQETDNLKKENSSLKECIQLVQNYFPDEKKIFSQAGRYGESENRTCKTLLNQDEMRSSFLPDSLGDYLNKEASVLAAPKSLSYKLIQFCQNEVAQKKNGEKLYTSDKISFDIIPCALQEIDFSGKIFRVNQMCCTMLHYSKSEMIGKYIWDFIDSEHDRTELKHIIASAYESHGKEKTFTVSVLTKTGKKIDIKLDWHFYNNNGEKFTGIILILTDITEFKRIEKSLEESQKCFRTLIEGSSDIIEILDSHGNILYHSPNIEHILGYDHEKITGLSSLLYHCHDKKSEVIGLFNELCNNPGMRKTIEISVKHKDGSLRFFKVIARNYLNNPAMKSIVIDYHDISQQKKAEQALQENEQRYHCIVKATNIAVWDWDIETNLTIWNENLTTLFGHPSGYIYDSYAWWSNHIHPDDRQRVLAGIKRVIEASENTWSDEYRFLCGHGNYSYVINRGSVIRDIHGKARKMIGTIMDITKRKQAENSILYANKEWEQAFDTLPDLIAIIDKDYFIKRMNKAMAMRLGISLHKAVGAQCYEKLHGLKKPPLFCLHTQVLKEKKEIISEVHDTCLGGDFIVSVSPLYDNNEELCGTVHVARDITERKKAEKVLLESEMRYRELVYNANSIILRMDTQGNLIFFNEFSQKFFGYTEEEILGRNVIGTIVPEVESSGRNLKALIKDLGHHPEKYNNNENENMRKNGERVWVAWTNKPVFDENGQVREILCIGNDISELKAAKDALKKERDTAQMYLEVAGVMFLVIDKKQKVTLVNQKCCEVLEYNENEIIGRNWFDNFLPEDERKQVKHIFDRLIDGEIDPIKYIESNVVTRSGKKKIIAWHNAVIKDEHGTITSTLSSGQDVTEKKQTEAAMRESEERYRMLIETANDAIVIADAETGLILTVNKKAEEMLGRPVHELIGMHQTAILPHDKNACINEPYLKNVKNYQGIAEEVCIRHKDGYLIPVEISTSVSHVGGRKIIQGIFRDITERKQLEEQLYQTQKLEAIGTLAGGIAHDFNNILMAIIGYTELALHDAPKDSLLEKNLHEVIKAGQRSKELVKQILTFSRQSKQEKNPVQLSLVIKEALKLLRASLPTTIEIRQNIHKDSGTVLADATQIHQIIMNLCVNAYQAMQGKNGILKVGLTKLCLNESDISVYPKLKRGDYFKITVSDTGQGIDRETIKRIFDPFFTTKGPGKGTGMGLSVVHGIVKSHGGTISVYSEPEKGTTFTVLLPALNEKCQAKLVPDTSIIGGNERILFVDDEEVIIQMNNQILERLGYRITARTNSLQALEDFRRRPQDFDLLITDLTMPHITGLELINEIMNIRSDIPIILCTGFSEIITREEAIKMGISEYILKPIITRELNSAIRRALKNKNKE
jgi:PAS domain S-box-containing protein